jgi:3'-5' exoribonuclease
MHNLIDFETPVLHPLDDGDYPTHLSRMPKIYRLVSIQYEAMDGKQARCTATLYHDRAMMKVSWTASRPDIRLRQGVLVSIRWLGKPACVGGAISISRLVLMECPEPWENLFHTVPHSWVKDRELVRQAASLFDGLPRSYRLIFNAIFWEGERFYRYCTVPASCHEQPVVEHGILHRAVEVALLIRHMASAGEIDHADLGILAGLLHEAGKADEYRWSAQSGWTLSERGRLLGHPVTLIEWIAAARVRCNLRMPEEEYMALLRTLSCSFTAPAWSAGRRPTAHQAILLASAA